MSNRPPEPLCAVCGTRVRHRPLRRHGDVWLCLHRCEPKTNYILTGILDAGAVSDEAARKDKEAFCA